MKVSEEMLAAAVVSYRCAPRNIEAMRAALEAALADYELAPFELQGTEGPALEDAREYARHGRAVLQGELVAKLVGIIDRAQRTLLPKQAAQLAATESELETCKAALVRESERADRAEAALEAEQSGGEWTEADCVAAEEALLLARGLSSSSEARSVLAAVSYRLRADTQVEPLSDEIDEDIEYLLKHQSGGESRRVAEELRRRFPKPAPKRTPEELVRTIHTHGTTSKAGYEALDELVRLAKGAEK